MGYDVWLGNNRGNKHSRTHIKLNAEKDKAFWEFSLHEMGLYDLPAMIDYILLKSHVSKLSYIGHSQGSTQLFAGLSEINDYYADKLNGFIALGPVTAMNNVKSSFVKVMAEYRIDSLFALLGINEILPSPESVNKFTSILCEKLLVLCDGMLELLSDSNFHDDDQERLLVFISHFPAGTSQQTLKHLASIIREKDFVRLDGKKYHLENVKIPVALFVGKDDKLATVEDNRILRNILLESNSLRFYKEYDNMGHATFFLNKNDEYLNDVLRCLNDFDK